LLKTDHFDLYQLHALSDNGQRKVAQLLLTPWLSLVSARLTLSTVKPSGGQTPRCFRS
jgi:hypothetical protein